MNIRWWIWSWFKWTVYMIKQKMGWLPPPTYETFFPLDKDDVVETEDNLQQKQVVEDTPAGQVRMKYNEETHTFLYWTDRSIPNYYLDTVARKYVVVYQEKEKYCIPRVEYIQAKTVEIKGPFVQCAPPVKHIEKKMNRYKYMGKLKEEPVVEKNNRKISFVEYKHGYRDGDDSTSLYKSE